MAETSCLLQGLAPAPWIASLGACFDALIGSSRVFIRVVAPRCEVPARLSEAREQPTARRAVHRGTFTLTSKP